jgi:hypothetical protein
VCGFANCIETTGEDFMQEGFYVSVRQGAPWHCSDVVIIKDKKIQNNNNKISEIKENKKNKKQNNNNKISDAAVALIDMQCIWCRGANDAAT